MIGGIEGDLKADDEFFLFVDKEIVEFLEFFADDPNEPVVEIGQERDRREAPING